MKEIWKTIPLFPNYQISNLGRVKSLWFKKEKILSVCIANGYKVVNLRIDKIKFVEKISFLMLITFIGLKPKGKEVSHLNNNRLDDRLENLKWETHQENMKRIIKLKEIKIIQIEKLIEKDYLLYSIANKFNVSLSTIKRIKRRMKNE